MRFRNISLSISGTLFLTSFSAFPQNTAHIGRPDPSQYIYTGPVTPAPRPAGAAQTPTGRVQIAVKLSDPPLVVAVGSNAKQNGISMSAAQQRAYLAGISAKQDAIASQITGLGGTILGRLSKAHNAVLASIDASRLQTLRSLSGVVAVRPVQDVAFNLAVTLPYIGATAVQHSGITGQGIKVAMLDTGIDYTHYNLGGSGVIADYQAAKAVAAGTPPANLFPTQKVVGGYDFTGEVWPGGPLAPDPNPIDLNGHGSHTADIVGGKSNDGLHVGTAPGTQLYAVKVCSSVSTACSGIAMLEGMEFALDPNNTGTLNSPVDIISMSIGGDFGLREQDDGEAMTDIVNFGVVCVVSAGNSGNIPYVLGGPAATPEVIAVAATTAANATVIPLVISSPASIAGTYANTAQITWAPITSPVQANIVYVGRACPGDTLLANPAGAIALVDRGVCAVSLKVGNVATAGAVGALIGLVAPGDAVTFSNGGGGPFVPSLVITQSTANVIKTALSTGPVVGAMSPANAISSAGNVAGYTSRGPNYSYNMLKPDLSAPGTVVAADAGTGNGQSSEDGTSFSCPLTAGSAALLLSKNHSLGPLDIKALLMETTEPLVYANVATQPGVLAPLSRIGSGELRVDRAVAASTSVWDATNPLAVSLSFGTYRLSANAPYKKKVIVRNYSATARTYSISNTFRTRPTANGVTLSFPSTLAVPANGSANLTLTLTVNAAALPDWTADGGRNGGNGELITAAEYDGNLFFTSGQESVHIPWHILPHKSANGTLSSNSVALSGHPVNINLLNAGGAAGALVDTFSLTGTGTQFPAASLPGPGSDTSLTNLRAVGVRLICVDVQCSGFAAQFAINTFGQRSHPDTPAEFDIPLDLDNDGTPDLIIFNEDIGLAQTNGATASGQNGVFIADLAADTASGPFAFSIAELDSANIVYTVPLSALATQSGKSLTLSTPFTFSVLAFDNYFTGNLTDQIANMRYELDDPRFYTDSDEYLAPSNGSVPVTILPNNATSPFINPAGYQGHSPSQTGILVFYSNGKVNQEADVVTVTP